MSFMSPVTASAPARTRRDLRPAVYLGFLAIFALLTALRLPLAWAEGRFQDEEATVFLAYAWHFPADALFRSFGGYLNIAANGTTLILAKLIRGGVISLENAPYFTMLAGLAAQLVPAMIVLNSRSPWLQDIRHRGVALLVLVLLPTTEEVFLNVMHIQFHLALGVALILCLSGGRGRLQTWFEAPVLFLAPLCGPAAILLLPLFALRALVDRDARRWRQFAILAAGAAIQLLLFYHSTGFRGVPFDPVNLAASLFIRLLALPFSGITGANFFGLPAAISLVKGGPTLWLIAALAVVTFSAILITTLKARDDAFWLFSAAICVGAVSLGFGMISRAPESTLFALAGPRYNYIPLVLIGLCFLCLAVRADPLERRMPRLLVLMMLFVGVVHYRHPYEDCADGPSWRSEVAAWRADPDHRLKVWPERFAADLSNKPVRCSDSADLRPTPGAPRYCQEGWMPPPINRPY